MISRNVLLFWHERPAPREVLDFHHSFSTDWPQCHTLLFDDVSAGAFLSNEFGSDVACLFHRCRFPAMRSDIFRLAWILKYGGMWIDIKFGPRAFPEPLFQSNSDLVCVRWYHGQIVNGVFLAPKGSAVIGRILNEALEAVSLRHGVNIGQVTGPGLWRRVIDSGESGWAIEIVDHDDLFRRYLSKRPFALSMRGTDFHWSEAQKREPLYRD